MRNVKKNYKKKKDNNRNVDMTQLKYSNNKYYASVLRYR